MASNLLLSDFIEASTVAKMAELIVERLLAQVPPDELAGILDELAGPVAG